MASRYWVGGNGNWNDTGHWSTSSGGASGASVPTSADDAIVDTNSGNPILDLNNQAAVCKTLTAGNPAYTAPQDSKPVAIKWSSSSTLGVAGNITIYGNVTFQFDSLTTQYFFMSANGDFKCYSNDVLPYWNQNSGGQGINLLGSHVILAKLKISAAASIGVDTLSSGNVPVVWVGNVDIANTSSTLNMYGHRLVVTGAHYSSLFDPVFVGAPAPGIFITPGSIGLANAGYIQVGTISDQHGSTNWGYGQDTFTFQFQNQAGNGCTIETMFVTNGLVTITGSNTFTNLFAIGDNGRTISVKFTGANKFHSFGDGVGEIVFPSATDQDIYNWSNDTTKTQDSYIHSSVAGSPATLKVRGTYTLTHVRFKDITVVHLVLTTLDSYGIANANTTESILGTSGNIAKLAQIFNVPADCELDNLVLWLSAPSAVSTTMIAAIYNITGTPGSTATPNTTSNTGIQTPVSLSSAILTTTPTPIKFSWLDNFARPGATLSAGNYAIQLRRSSSSAAGIAVSLDTTSPTHSGNYARLITSGSWSADATKDICFMIQGWVVSSDPAFIVFGGTNEGDNSGITFANKFDKYYRYDIYTPPTSAFPSSLIGTLPSGEIISEFSYDNEINNVAGELVIRRAVEPETVMYTGDDYIGYRNKVVVKCFSEFNPSGVTVYIGFIAGWRPQISGSNKYVDITVLSYASELSQLLVINDPTIDVNIDQSGSALSFSATRIAVSFTTGVGVTNLAALNLSAIGIPLADDGYDITIKIYKDNGSNTPDNTAILKTISMSAGYGTPGAGFGYLPDFVQVAGGLTVSASSKYWAVVDITSPVSGYYIDNSTVYTTNGYASGNVAYWNGSSWVQSSAYGIKRFATYSSNTSTQVTYTGGTVQEALENIMENYALQGGLVNSIPSYGLDTSEINVFVYPTADFEYVFQNNTVQDALNQLVAQAGAGWYWYDDVANMAIGFRNKNDSLGDSVEFQMERDVIEFNLEFSLEEVVNDLLIIGGDNGGGVNLFREYINYASIARYGRRQAVLDDSNLVDSTAADAVGVAYIQEHGLAPVVRAPIIVGDAFFFERLHPGMLFSVFNGTMFTNNYQISRLGFSPGSVTITASTVPTQVTNQTQYNTNKINQIRSVGNPTAPTVISV